MNNQHVRVSLDHFGQLQLELPAVAGAWRMVALSANQAEATIKRILQALAGDKTEIGEDGAPTIVQVRHWEKHQDWPSDRCKFCISEGRIKGPSEGRKRKESLVIARYSSGVEVRRVAKGKSGNSPKAGTKKAAGELGL